MVGVQRTLLCQYPVCVFPHTGHQTTLNIRCLEEFRGALAHHGCLHSADSFLEADRSTCITRCGPMFVPNVNGGRSEAPLCHYPVCVFTLLDTNTPELSAAWRNFREILPYKGAALG
ncbi:hypothetical protein TcYC6_0026170 [Trypanosoma cruzi]|nr:hypothetical protein TcYC6_0026170 [Trypanosoma cruzi]